MKTNPYASSTGSIQATGTRGKALTRAAASSSTRATQRIRPLSLRLPNSGLLTTEARKIPESARPVNLGLNPCAFWRKSEAEVDIALPAKSRKLRAKLAPKKNNHRDCEGNNRSVELQLCALIDS